MKRLKENEASLTPKNADSRGTRPYYKAHDVVVSFTALAKYMVCHAQTIIVSSWLIRCQVDTPHGLLLYMQS